MKNIIKLGAVLLLSACGAQASWISPAEATAKTGKPSVQISGNVAAGSDLSLSDLSLAETQITAIRWEDVRTASSLGSISGGSGGGGPITNDQGCPNPFDPFDPACIPEPGTVAAGMMMALALGGTVWRRYRA